MMGRRKAEKWVLWMAGWKVGSKEKKRAVSRAQMWAVQTAEKKEKKMVEWTVAMRAEKRDCMWEKTKADSTAEWSGRQRAVV